LQSGSLSDADTKLRNHEGELDGGVADPPYKGRRCLCLERSAAKRGASPAVTKPPLALRFSEGCMSLELVNTLATFGTFLTLEAAITSLP
jgi:hypothetical protein